MRNAQPDPSNQDPAVVPRHPLTKPQERELRRLAREPQGSYGASTVRLHNTLVKLGLAVMSAGEHGVEYCVITPMGCAWLR